ncbi:MAG: hypothetical protein E4H39_00675 [Syntrophobacterales bacterium]|nr:MAG: hypothetical protein E4H39_00675 [Syntrophobacterales bacterium]
MTSNKDTHIGEDLLVRILADETGMPDDVRDHLSRCPLCGAAKDNLEGELARLGRMAKMYSPTMGKRISLPEDAPRRTSGWFWNWQAASGVAAIATIVLVVVSWNVLFRVQPGLTPDIINQELIAAEELMTEVDILVNNALPAVYQDISGESYSEVDEEFIDYVVPAAYEDVSRFVDGKTKIGGEKLC